MNIFTVLEMATSEFPDRVAVGRRDGGVTFGRLAEMSVRVAQHIRGSNVNSVAFVGVNGPAWPVCMFAAAAAGVPVAPLNYRLSPDRLGSLVGRLESPLVIADERYLHALAAGGVREVLETSQLLASIEGPLDASATPLPQPEDPDATAVILFTSGTTAEPKGVLLRHTHLFSYIIHTVEFAGADADEAALVSVPPYHVAGVGTVLSNMFAGRRLFYLPDFTPGDWLSVVREQRITQAMLVPTMLARIMEELGANEPQTPSLRSIAYGGASMPRPVLIRALKAMPDVSFVNSYGLTETSSTIAILGPDEHRAALDSDDPVVAARLGSAGRLVPGLEAQIRDPDGQELPVGVVGELWVRGAQVSAEYMGQGPALDGEGWFATRDEAVLDADGYLFIIGRTDDTIIRGGENIAPAEIETVLREHPAVDDVVVIGLPDEEWGQRIVAVVVPTGTAPSSEDVRSWVRERLRGSRTPDDVVFLPQLPYSHVGKLVRRDLEELILAHCEEKETS